MSREKFLEEALELMKEMSPEERGELVADLLQLSIKLSTDECINSSVKELFKNEKVN